MTVTSSSAQNIFFGFSNSLKISTVLCFNNFYNFTKGMMVGPIIAGFIFDTTGAYTTVYAVGAGLFVLCAVIMMAVKPVVDCAPMQKDPRKKKKKRSAMMREMELLDAIDEEHQEKV